LDVDNNIISAIPNNAGNPGIQIIVPSSNVFN